MGVFESGKLAIEQRQHIGPRQLSPQRRDNYGDRHLAPLFVRPADDRRLRDVAALKEAKHHEKEVLAEYSADEAQRLKSMLQTLIERNRALPSVN